MKKKNNKNNGEIKFVTSKLKKETTMNEDLKLVMSLIVILIVMAVLGVLLYYFNAKFVTKDEFQTTTTTTTAEVTYDDSLLTVDTMFKKGKGTYYVMLFDSSDDNSLVYSNLVTYYQGDKTLYSVDMHLAMNKKYYNTTGTENKTPTKASEVMITQPTLIQFKKGKVVSYVTDKDEIISILSETATS